MAYSVPTESEIRNALTYIDATERQTWVSVGTALKTEFGESGFNLFDDWSRQAENYKAADAKSAWKSFRIGKSNIGYVIKQARQNGWQREKSQPTSSAEIEKRRQAAQQAARQAEKEKLQEQAKAKIYAQNIWKNADRVNPNHAYLRSKGIDNPSVLQSIRQQGDTLIIPVKNRGQIVGIQRIFEDGSKRFNRGIEKKGSAFVMGNRDEMQHGFLMAEGFATAATLHIATGKPVVVAFDAGNLKDVAGNLKGFVAKNQTPVLICADKDEKQTGEIKAKTAAEVLGSTATVITPDFTDKEISDWQQSHNGKMPTDFNDLQAIGGVERVSVILSEAKNRNQDSSPAVQNDEIQNRQPEPTERPLRMERPQGNLNNKLLINIYGSPATGKSYTAENLVVLLKENGIECELVTEYATELIRQGQAEKLKNQVAVTSEQIRRQQEALNKADIVITDSPVSLGMIYSPDEQKAEVTQLVEQSKTTPYINILLRHNHESLEAFSMNGRIHNKEQSLAVQDKIIDLLQGENRIHHERGITLEELVNNIGVDQQWQQFAELNNIQLPRFEIAMDGTVMNKDDNLSGSLNVAENDTLVAEKTSESVTMTEEMPKPERALWEKDFPKAVTNDLKGNLIDLPNYQAAKSGDHMIALEMVKQILTDDTVEQLKRNFAIDKDTLIVPVNALEAAGNNPIPSALAYELSNRLGLELHTDIVQATRVARTRKSADYRLVFQPAFTGEVLPNRNYLIVDDTLIQGGTVASLRGYINNRGGKVIGVAVLSAKEHSLQLAPTPEILHNINHKFGKELNEYWQKEFNYGINQLTNSEAVVLSKGNDFVSIRNRIAQEILSAGDTRLQTAGTEIIPKELHAVIREIKDNNPNNVLRLETPKDVSNGRVFYETENFVIQQVADNSRYFQAWNKQDLDIPLKIGDKAKIYLDKQGKTQIKITQQAEEPNPETPRPPQGGFVLSAINQSNENRQAESISKENTMAEQTYDFITDPKTKQILDSTQNNELKIESIANPELKAELKTLNKEISKLKVELQNAVDAQNNFRAEGILGDIFSGQEDFDDAIKTGVLPTRSSYSSEYGKILSHQRQNTMENNQELDEVYEKAKVTELSPADIQAMIQQNQADIAKAEETIRNNNIQNRQAETPLSTEQRRAMAAENSLYAQANSDRETLLQHNEVLQKHTLTPAEPLQPQSFQADTFPSTDSAWQPENWQPETPQDFNARQEELNQRREYLANLQRQLDAELDKANQQQNALKQERLADLDKEYEKLYCMQNEVDRWNNDLDLKRSQILGADTPETELDENGIQLDDRSPDNIITKEEILRNLNRLPYASNDDKVQAAFNQLEKQYGYQRNGDVLEVSGSKNQEQMAYNQETQSLEYTALNDKGERHLIGDIEIKDLSPEYMAVSLENRRLQYQQELNKNGGRALNPAQRQALDRHADTLDERVRQANRKSERLTPPLAPPPPLDQRYAAVERKFLDTKTNLRVSNRVDYVDVANGRTVLFSDKGNKLTTSKNPDAQTVKDMVELAKAKGWDSVKLRGNKEFKRMAYIEMESQGIKTKGYSPSPQDLAMVEKLREERSLSGIESISHAGGISQTDKTGTLNNGQPESMGNRHVEPIGETSHQDSSPAVQNDGLNSGRLNNNPNAEQTAEKGGILLSHGKAPYQHNPDNKESYYATIEYPDGEKTYWGKDIERVLQDNHINTGDRIELQKTGKIENVRVQEIVRDEQGEPVLDENGQPKYEEVMRQRNVWEVNVHQHSTNEATGNLKTVETSSPKKQDLEQLRQDYHQAKATLTPKQQEYLSVAERLIHHSFEKEHISAHTREYYLGNFYRNTTAEIKNGTIDIPSPYAKSQRANRTRSITKPKTQTKGVSIG